MQRNKSENVMTPGLLHPLLIPNQKWAEISMDFIEGLPMSERKDKILMVVDRLTKYAHFIGVKKKNSAKHITEVFCKNIYKLHGFLNSLSVIEMSNLKVNFGRSSTNKLGHTLT